MRRKSDLAPAWMTRAGYEIVGIRSHVGDADLIPTPIRRSSLPSMIITNLQDVPLTFFQQLSLKVSAFLSEGRQSSDFFATANLCCCLKAAPPGTWLVASAPLSGEELTQLAEVGTSHSV